jgi:hypothetical protein
MEMSLEDLFPALRSTSYQITSPPSDKYNCIAWAAGDTKHWWWPDADLEDNWPEGVIRAQTLAAFESAFSTLGFVPCDNSNQEHGFEKVALFAAPDGSPKHAARQLANGRWTSKLGLREDIEHNLHDLEGLAYGSVVRLLKRPIQEAKV